MSDLDPEILESIEDSIISVGLLRHFRLVRRLNT